MKTATAVAVPVTNPVYNSPRKRSLEMIQKELEKEKICQEFNQIQVKINNEIILNRLDEKLDKKQRIEREKEKFGYHGKRSYAGLEFVIEFCNRNFVPITKLEKLYLDKFYLYLESSNKINLLNQYNDSELLGFVFNNAIDKKQIAINFKRYIGEIVALIEKNNYEEATSQILGMLSILSNQENTDSKVIGIIKKH